MKTLQPPVQKTVNHFIPTQARPSMSPRPRRPLASALCFSVFALFLSTADGTFGKSYQYIYDNATNWWGQQEESAWSGAPWDGLPQPGGPGAGDDLDLNATESLNVIGSFTTPSDPLPFTALINNITVTEYTGIAILNSRNNWLSTLEVLGDITISDNRSLQLRDRNASSSLTVNVDGDVTVGDGGILYLGTPTTGSGSASTANNRLRSISVLGKTTINGSLLNAVSNINTTTSTFLGDLEVDGLLVVAAAEEDFTGAGSVTNEISIRSLSGSGTVHGSNIKGNGTRSTTLKFQTEADSNEEFSGTLLDSQVTTTGTGVNRLGVTISGTGQQSFSGNNTYSGQTLVSSGKLLVNGTHIQADSGQGGGVASGLYQIADGGTLGGSGRIAGKITGNNSHMIYVESGGTLAPGTEEAMGVLTIDGGLLSETGNVTLNMAAGAEFAFRLAGDGSDADRLTFWNYSAHNSAILSSNRVNLTLAGPLVAGTYTVTLFDFFSNDGTTATSSHLSDGLTLHLDASISFAELIYNGHDISLQYTVTVIPEPDLVTLAFCSLLSLAILRRFTRHS
ncbi:MAG TPA: hypothetical protein VNQ90_08880 [Chthoniobacteraceae bacterium]|nr:hypothetical protein [Chthoniobacteraceae bacterium]